MSKLTMGEITFDEDKGVAVVNYNYKGHVFTGASTCHEDDKDMQSKTVGYKYAELRAYIKFLSFKKQELSIVASTLEGTMKNMMTSKDFNPKSKYAAKLQNSICHTRCELHKCREEIKSVKEYLKKNIQDREEFYIKIRKSRAIETQARFESENKTGV
ncbi:MAG: hypothetical protein RR744_10485 [Cellulosilyticaceae bacterium]